jgi:hypothetical protein
MCLCSNMLEQQVDAVLECTNKLGEGICDVKATPLDKILFFEASTLSALPPHKAQLAGLALHG